MPVASSVVLGKIIGAFGIKGWVKIHSYTESPTAIFEYQPWQLIKGQQILNLQCLQWQRQAKGLVAQLDTITDREQAQLLAGYEIHIQRSQLPPLLDNDYYWSDLEGLAVVNLQGISLGQVDHLFETGANDVMVVKGERERLIPWILQQVVQQVDLQQGVIKVDWDAEF